jgi:hypothetical protein
MSVTLVVILLPPTSPGRQPAGKSFRKEERGCLTAYLPTPFQHLERSFDVIGRPGWPDVFSPTFWCVPYFFVRSCHLNVYPVLSRSHDAFG